jgi:hypothetical protein
MAKLKARFYEIHALPVKWGRSYLDIVTDPTTKIDLLIIMLNPGSCSSKEPLNDKISIEVNPDPTLKRIITLLNKSNHYKNCRVLNLSDVQEPNSKEFFKNQDLYLSKYSIFSHERKSELEALISPNMKAIIAWGVQVKNSEKARESLIMLKSLNVEILNEDHSQFHPLVRIKGYSWAFEISKLLPHFS